MPASAAAEGEPPEPRAGSWNDLRPGEAAVFEAGEDRVAAYRDADGRLHRVSGHCTHMDCHVHWSNADRTWDGECHGSTFEPDGSVIHGPAVAPLPPQGGGR